VISSLKAAEMTAKTLMQTRMPLESNATLLVR